MAANYKLELVGVLGYPVAENPTCVMQEAAFGALSLPWRYLTLEVPPSALPDAIRGVRALGMRGVNLTIPHKVAVMELLDEISPDAKLIGAVNTVRREGDRLIGENTDGKGFLRGIVEEAGINPKAKQVVILGAGGAARAIAVELTLAGAGHITIVNRSSVRGEELAAYLRTGLKAEAHFVPWTETYDPGTHTDILVNATSIGLFPNVNDMVPVDLQSVRPDCLICDVIPNPPETPLIRSARQQGLKTLTGLPILVNQGAIGFKMWTGQKAPEDVMRKALERAFGL